VGSWFSIEVLDGDGSARLWADAWSDVIIWAAQRHGVIDWEISEHPWGVLVEIEVRDEDQFDALRADIAHALDAVPDPIRGLLVHPGRGGSAGSRIFRGPRPILGSGAMAVPIPEPVPA
jgi:hypothetical protein